MQAVILAGGKGTRLHPLTTTVPKPMVPLFDRPVMEHTVKLLARHGVTEIIVTLSHMAREVIDYFGDGSRWGVRMRYSVEAEPLGTAGGVKLVQSMIEDTFVIVSGDAVTDLDLDAAVRAHKSSSAIVTLMLSESDDPTEFGVVETDPTGKIVRFLEKPKSDQVFANTINTGIYIMEPEALSSIPHFREFDFARQLFPRMLANQEPVYGFAVPGYWCDVGDLNQYRNAHFDALVGRVKLEMPAMEIGDGVWTGERVEIHPSVELSSPIFLGDGVIVRQDAVLGERSVIGAESLVDEGASISRSIIGAQSYVGKNSKISYSTIGGGCSIGEGETVTERALIASTQYATPTAPATAVAAVKKVREQRAAVRQPAV